MGLLLLLLSPFLGLEYSPADADAATPAQSLHFCSLLEMNPKPAHLSFINRYNYTRLLIQNVCVNWYNLIFFMVVEILHTSNLVGENSLYLFNVHCGDF